MSHQTTQGRVCDPGFFVFMAYDWSTHPIHRQNHGTIRQQESLDKTKTETG
jgi:hypothetical protein